MLTFLYVEINVFAMVILCMIYFNLRNQAEKFLYEQKLFLKLLFFNFLILFFDTFMWAINGRTGAGFREINLAVTLIYYCLSPVPCLLWSLYTDYQIYRDEWHVKRLLIPFLIPIAVTTVFSCLSLFGDFFFYIDRYNLYHRGRLFFLMVAICYFYLTYTFILVYLKRDKIGRQNYLTLLLFPVLPFIGSILQSAVYGLSLIWVSMTLSSLMVFINIQNKLLYTDHLTGLFNRKQFDNYLREKISNHAADKLLAGIMIDINYFKSINDLYGHSVGDQALQNTADILKKSVGKENFVARFGGDEFMAILEVGDPSELVNIVNKIKKNVNLFNAQKKAPYSISLSMGYDIMDNQSGMNMEDFIKKIDDLMYREKERIKTRGPA